MPEKARYVAELHSQGPEDHSPCSDPASERAALHSRLGIGIPFDEIRAWVESWDTDHERPPPEARKIF